MIKIRIEYADSPKRCEELEKLIDVLEESYTILNRSKPYTNRNSLYKRIYVEVEEKGPGATPSPILLCMFPSKNRQKYISKHI